MLESGLPGQAEHERVAAAAEPQRLAGLHAHAPEHLLDAAGLERRLDVVVRADRDAAGDDQHVAAPGRASTAARVDVEVVGDRRRRRSTSRARALGQQPHHQPVGLVDLARLGRRAERQQLRAGDEHVQPRAAVDGDLADARRRRARRRARASAARRRARAGRRRGRPRRGSGRGGRARSALGGAHACRRRARPARTAGSASAPGGSAAPVVMPSAVPGSSGSVARLAGGDLAGQPQRRRRRCRPRGPRSRPSPSGRTAAGRRRCGPSSAATRPAAVGERHALGLQRRGRPRGPAPTPRDRARFTRRSATSSAPAGRSPASPMWCLSSLRQTASRMIASSSASLAPARSGARRSVSLSENRQVRSIALGGQADAVAVAAERLGDGGDEADLALPVGEAPAPRGAVALAADRLERVHRRRSAAGSPRWAAPCRRSTSGRRRAA